VFKRFSLWRDAWRKWRCEYFHDEPMCPVSGRWKCRICQFEHVVRFEPQQHRLMRSS